MGTLTACTGVMAGVIALSGSVAAEFPIGQQVPIRELCERTNAFIGRDLILSDVAWAVESITEENFDDWWLMSSCAGSYFDPLEGRHRFRRCTR